MHANALHVSLIGAEAMARETERPSAAWNVSARLAGSYRSHRRLGFVHVDACRVVASASAACASSLA